MLTWFQITSTADVRGDGAYYAIESCISGRGSQCIQSDMRWGSAAHQRARRHGVQSWRVRTLFLLFLRWLIKCGGSYKRAAALFQESLDLAHVTQSSQKSWSTTHLNLGTCYRKLQVSGGFSFLAAAWLTHSKRRFEEAKTQYQRVLEIDPWHAQALAFLGMVYHLLNETDKAIVKYHEVGSVTTPNRNMHIIISLPISRL